MPGCWGGVYPLVEPQIQEEQCSFCLSWTSSLPSQGCWMVHGSLPNQSTYVLWPWKKHTTLSLGVSCGGCLGSMGYWAHCYEPFIPCITENLICINGNKSNSFLVGLGLCQGCPLSLIKVMNRLLRFSQGVECVHLASSSCDLQLALGRFAAKCEVSGMRISTFNSEAMVLSRKRGTWPLWFGMSHCLKWGSSSIMGSCSWVMEE